MQEVSMRIKKIKWVYCLIICLGVLSLWACKKKTDKNEGRIEEVNQVASPCESDWFPHSQTPAPAEGKGSPFDTNSTTNIIFHQWAVQKYLWLTKPSTDSTLLFQDSLIFVSADMIPVKPVNGIDLVLTDTLQADGNVMKSNPKFNKLDSTFTVHYSIHVSDIMAVAAKTFKDVIIKGGKESNDYTFPVGSLELKVAWVDTNAISSSEIGKYYTTQAVIQDSIGNQVTTRVAMLGIHVVGVVENHPEFIWGTFEHEEMVPAYQWGSTPPVTSNDQKLFYQQGHIGTQEDILTQPSTNVFTLYRYGVPKYGNGNFTQSSQQEPINYDNIDSLNTCVQENLTGVFKHYLYNGALWINTDGMSMDSIVDTLNTLGYDLANVSPGDIPKGSVAASNITMETTFQLSKNDTMSHVNIADMQNCFTCHNARTNLTIGDSTYQNLRSPLYISHIFKGYMGISSGVSKANREKIRLQNHLKVISGKSK